MHFYDFNIGDYAKKTRHLTNNEDLAYRRLLDMYYDTEQPITHRLATLSRLLRLDENSIKNVMDEFFPDGKNRHADEVIAEYHAYLLKQSENGKKGGRPKNQDVAITFENNNKPTANPPFSQNNPVPSQPLTTNHEPLTTKPNIKPLSEYSDDFVNFWKAYPEKTGKAEAFKSWKKVKPVLVDVLKALEWQTRSQKWVDGYIPNPQTYLNQGRWQDEPQTTVNGNRPWFMTASGIESKAREKGLNIGRDESIPAFLQRVKISEGITI